MTMARWRVLIVALLFFGWIGWLSYTAWSSRGMNVVSRAQVLTASTVVVAEVESVSGDPFPEVKVKEVLATKGKHPTIEINVPLKIMGLENLKSENGWKGKGDYVIPLTYNGQEFELHGIPKSPVARPKPRIRIYQVDDQVLAQTRAYLDAKNE